MADQMEKKMENDMEAGIWDTLVQSKIKWKLL